MPHHSLETDCPFVPYIAGVASHTLDDVEEELEREDMPCQGNRSRVVVGCMHK